MKKYLDIRLVKTFSPYSVSKPERDGKRTVGQQLLDIEYKGKMQEYSVRVKSLFE
jgi:hypothetical protein